MESLAQVRDVVLVLSGKGGVGKSSVTAQLALSLSAAGHKVGVLDIDLTGPSLPRMLGLEGCAVHQAAGGWVPVACAGIKVMSIGFLLKDRGDAVVWRGPKKTAMVRQFLTDVVWGELDYLLIDTPPGTSDEHLGVVERLRAEIKGAVLVTTPQEVSLGDVRRELSFCNKVGVRVLGLVENLAGYSCPCCEEVTHVFASGGGEKLAQDARVEFLGSIPIEPAFVEVVETQPQGQGAWQDEKSLVAWYPKSKLAPRFKTIAQRVHDSIRSNEQAGQ